MFYVYLILGLLLLAVIRAAFISKQALIEREILIERPIEDVFAFVVLLRNHRLFNKWTMTDPNVNIAYSGEDGHIGFTTKWSSDQKNVGAGEQKIISITTNARIDYDLIFISPFEGLAKSYIITRSTESGTLVTWGFQNERNFLAKLMQALLNLEKVLGKDLEISLNNLKQLLEKK